MIYTCWYKLIKIQTILKYPDKKNYLVIENTLIMILSHQVVQPKKPFLGRI